MESKIESVISEAKMRRIGISFVDFNLEEDAIPFDKNKEDALFYIDASRKKEDFLREKTILIAEVASDKFFTDEGESFGDVLTRIFLRNEVTHFHSDEEFYEVLLDFSDDVESFNFVMSKLK